MMSCFVWNCVQCDCDCDCVVVAFVAKGHSGLRGKHHPADVKRIKYVPPNNDRYLMFFYDCCEILLVIE